MLVIFSFFFFNDTATTEIYTLSLHDALPILESWREPSENSYAALKPAGWKVDGRSEEHTSELQSHSDLVCRLLLEKKKTRQLLLHSTCGTSSRCNRQRLTTTRATSVSPCQVT